VRCIAWGKVSIDEAARVQAEYTADGGSEPEYRAKRWAKRGVRVDAYSVRLKSLKLSVPRNRIALKSFLPIIATVCF